MPHPLAGDFHVQLHCVECRHEAVEPIGALDAVRVENRIFAEIFVDIVHQISFHVVQLLLLRRHFDRFACFACTALFNFRLIGFL